MWWKRDRDFEEEVEQHIRLLAERFQKRGLSAEEAWSQARRQFGNRAALNEQRRDLQPLVWLETLSQDLRYAVRMLAHNKAFAAVAILTLALGIGANTAIFSVVNAVVLRPLPYPDASRLVVLWGNVKRARVERRGASYPDFLDWRKQSSSFSEMAAYDGGDMTLAGNAGPELITGEVVSPAYFDLLGIQAELGRLFDESENQPPEGRAVVVLSDGAWKRRFGGDTAVLGRTLRIDNRAYTIIGVGAPRFRGLTDQAEIWMPFATNGADSLGSRGSRGFRVLARLKADVTIARAQAEMDTISQRLARAYPNTNQARGVELTPLDRETFGDLRKPLVILMVAVGFVLLIAGTNVVSLLLARSEIRRHEIAMRTALGASGPRLLRQLLAEAGVLVTLGCAAGLALARLGANVLMAASPIKFPSFVHPAIDSTVAAFTIAVSCITALALGLAPALQIRAGRLDEALRQASNRSTSGRGGLHFRDTLVAAEIAVSLLLLIGAGLMIRSLAKLSTIDLGYTPSHVTAFGVSLPRLQPGANGNVAVTASEILRRVSSIPSVQSASIGTDSPLRGGGAVFYAAEGQPLMDARTEPRCYFHRVSPDFFRTLRTPFLAGRPFTEEEVHRGADVAIVTENLTRRFWPGQDPIGKRVKVGGISSTRAWLEIVGVVPEMKYRGVPDNPTADPDLFQVFNERALNFDVMVRSSREPAQIARAVQTVLRQAEPSILIARSAPLEEFMAEETARPRFTGWLMAIFAGAALALAAIGIYGVISYNVSRRTREIGLRMALGAARRDVLRMVVGRGMTIVAAGLGIGVAAALVLTRLMSAVLYGVDARDSVTFAAAALVLAFVAMLSCLLPAARATRIAPADALRE